MGKTRFHKSQGLGFINGEVPTADSTKPGIGGDPLTGQSRSSKTSAFPTDGRPAQPAWLAFSRKVLRFYAYFREPVHERQDETHRVRYCTVLFYLEDDTVQVNEKITDNSGMPQGILVRRHRVPNAANDADFLNVYDFNVDTELNIYARTYHVVDCDPFTRDFLTKMGVVVNEPADAPIDSYTVYRAERADAANPLRPYEKRDTLAQFLQHDQQVLRFYGLWDDSAAEHGDKRFMTVHYFLADDSIEINEILPRNSGRDGGGAFLKKQKVPKKSAALAKPPGSFADRTVLNVVGGGMKSSSILDSLRLGASTDEYYTDKDLMIGNTLTIFERPLLLHDCDAFTKMYYAEKYGVTDFTPIEVQDKPKPPPPKVVPPPTGYGSEVDSMISVDRLVLQPPRQKAGKYYPKRFTGDEGSLVLRFEAVLDTTDPLDSDRKFIVSRAPTPAPPRPRRSPSWRCRSSIICSTTPWPSLSSPRATRASALASSSKGATGKTASPASPSTWRTSPSAARSPSSRAHSTSQTPTSMQRTTSRSWATPCARARGGRVRF